MLIFVLFSCSSEWKTKDTLSTLKTQDFSISVPANWTKRTDSFPTPKMGEVVLALASENATNNYVNNLVILKIDSVLGESSKGLMENTKIWLKSQLQFFSLEGEKSIIFGDKDEGTVLSYVGQYSKSTPKLFYIQTAKHCDEKNFFLTLSLAEKPENLDRYIDLLGTFSCN